VPGGLCVAQYKASEIR